MLNQAHDGVYSQRLRTIDMSRMQRKEGGKKKPMQTNNKRHTKDTKRNRETNSKYGECQKSAEEEKQVD